MFCGVNFAIHSRRKILPNFSFIRGKSLVYGECKCRHINCLQTKNKNKERKNIKNNVKCSTLCIFKMINYKRETPFIQTQNNL